MALLEAQTVKELLRSLGMRLWLCVVASGAQEKPAFSVGAPRRSSCSANSIIQVTYSICCAQDRWRTILRKIQSSTSVVLPPLYTLGLFRQHRFQRIAARMDCSSACSSPTHGLRYTELRPF